METNNHVRSDRLAQQRRMEIINYEWESVVAENIPKIAKESASNSEKQEDSSNNDFAKDAVESARYELAEARSALKHVEYIVQRSKYIIDQNPAKPKNYDEWTDKEQFEHIMSNLKIYFPNSSDSLLCLVRAAPHRGDCGRSSTEKPLWLDMDKFRRGQRFARDHIFSIFFVNVLSLFQIFAFPDALKPLILSRQSHTPYLAFKRYLSTSFRVRNWFTEDPWTEGTQAYKDIQTVRRMHRAMRLKLCEHNYEEINAAAEIPNLWCPDRETILNDFSSACPFPSVENGCIDLLIKSKRLNQADMAATQFAFMGLIVLHPREFGIYADEEDLEAFCHLWRSIGYLLGMEDEYNFCRGNLKEIKQRTQDFTEICMKAHLRQVTAEWEHMSRCLVEGINYYISPVTFKMALLFIANLLNIAVPRMRKTLTYFQRLKLVLVRFSFRYVMRLRFVRERMNKKLNRALDRTITFSPEMHEKLKKRSSQKVLDFPAILT